MRTRRLGDRDGSVEVSEFCLGTIPFGTRTGQDTAFALLDRFFEAGGTFHRYRQQLRPVGGRRDRR